MNATLDLWRETVSVLEEEGVEPLLIGAAALAVHGYSRFTEDADFAVAMAPRDLESLTDKLPGHAVFSAPEPADPLGGVTTVLRQDGKVQIVNFDNQPGGGFPALVRDALARSKERVFGVRVAGLEDLILFKAYAGGPKSRADVAELLVRRSPDMNALRALARGYGITRELDYVLDLPEK